jgi:hypothetical protein
MRKRGKLPPSGTKPNPNPTTETISTINGGVKKYLV